MIKEVGAKAPNNESPEAATPRPSTDQTSTRSVTPAAATVKPLDANGTGDGFSPLDAARLYGAHHLVPIPWRVVNGRKKPTIRAWNDPSQRPSFERLLPEFAKQGTGVGLVTGRPGGARIIVVDVDVKGTTSGDPTPFLDTTPCSARTPSGGCHFFYSDARDAADADIATRAGGLLGGDFRA